jgi:hypothetical protein
MGGVFARIAIVRSPFRIIEFKFGFIGEYGRTPKRNFLKEVPLWTLLKNFQKGLFINVF